MGLIFAGYEAAENGEMFIKDLEERITFSQPCLLNM